MIKSHLFQVLKNTVKHNIFLVITLIVSIIVTLVLTLLPPLVLERGIDNLLNNHAFPIYLIVIYFVVLILSGVSETIRETSITIFGEKVLHELRSEMSKKLNRIESSYLINHDAGEITTYFVGDVDTIETLFNEGVISMVVDVLTVIGIIIVVFTRSIGLGILLCISAPILMVYTRHVQTRMLKSQKENRKAIAKAGEIIPETLKNACTIHNLDEEEYMKNRYDSFIQKSYKAMEKANFYDSIYSPIVIVFSAVIIAIMMILSSTNSSMQALFSMSVGTATALITYVNKVFTPLESIGMEIQNIQTALAGISQINAFLDENEQEVNHELYTFDRQQDAISINNATFSYEKDKPIIKSYSLNITSNESVTITGRTGAGKSTLFKLILGLYACDKGNVQIYGVPSTMINEQDKRNIFGCVEQSFKATRGTLKDQITLKDPTITSCEVYKALEIVGLKDIAHILDDVFDPSVFSQGQLQLLSIARAIVKNPSILLLDEMTANLDALTEKLIMQAIGKASENRTVLSISHRTYALKNSREVKLERV